MSNPNRATEQQWRLLHSYVVDGVLSQDEDECTGVQIVIGGLSLRSFMESIADGSRVRVRPLLDDYLDIVFRVEVLTDFGDWQGLTRPPAEALGVSPDEAFAALEDWFRRNPDDLLPPDPEVEG
jgi:hypothetical protein